MIARCSIAPECDKGHLNYLGKKSASIASCLWTSPLCVS